MAVPRKEPLRIGWKTVGDSWSLALPASRPAAGQVDDLIVSVPAKNLEAHALIVGQSGSGKSYFLGRLVEEIMIRTSARCVVVDPNDDFARVLDLAGPGRDPWNWPHKYTEDSRATFETAWAQVPVFLKSATKDRSMVRLPGGVVKPRKPRFFWHDVPPELVAAIISPGEDPHLRRTISSIHQFVHLTGTAYIEAGVAAGDLGVLARQVILQRKPWPSSGPPDLPNAAVWRGIIGKTPADWDIYSRFMTRCTTNYPFSAGADPQFKADPKAEKSRLDVLDVASVDDPEIRALAVGTLLWSEWARSRQLWSDAANDRPVDFFPTFLVLDEAHNVVPQQAASPYAGALRDQVRTIAAEGRKYGLFVMLSTQRPDKLDTHVVSECRNAAILRMVSPGVLRVACDLLGVEYKAAEPTLEVESGQGLGVLFGSWAGKGERTGTRFKGAARRTAEGGAPLDERWHSR